MSSADFPGVFARLVADAVPGMLKHQRADGAIVLDPKAPIVYPQQAIFPLAFCYVGKDPEQRHKGSPELAKAITKLGNFLVNLFDEKGQVSYDSHGYKVVSVDQRLTNAWTEALFLLRESGADFDYAKWSDKIERACGTLIEHRLKHLPGVRRFIGRVLGTGTNHVALYLSTVYRAGVVLKKPELCEFALPIARAFANDVHPDGYWDEHTDLLRTGGPTPSYSYLSHGAVALMYAWTGEPVFRAALDRSTRFHANFTYPDACVVDLFAERVRSGHSHAPSVWGIFGFSHTPEGRGSAIAHFNGWRAAVKDIETVTGEILSRHCENFLYWESGDVVPPPFERPGHTAKMILPAGIFRRGAWCIGLSCMRATNVEDPAYVENAFALDRQKLFSVWHEKTHLLIDGSHSKKQPENSTFCAPAPYATDFWPCGGAVGEEDADLVARATYKSFIGEVRVRPLSDHTLQIDFSVDPVGNRGPFTVAFTLRKSAESVVGLNGKETPVGEAPFELTSAETGGGFRHGLAVIEGPPDLKLNWPMLPYNSYTSDHKPWAHDHMLRVSLELTPERTHASVVIKIKE